MSSPSPCKCEKIRAIEVLHLFRCYTHTHICTATNAPTHACHAKCRGVTGDQWRPSAPPEPAQCHKCHACQRECRLVDVTKCHTCHEKRRWMSPSATPTRQSTAASPTTSGAQARHQSQPSATPARQSAAASPATRSGAQARHQSQRSAISATPAKENVDW